MLRFAKKQELGEAVNAALLASEGEEVQEDTPLVALIGRAILTWTPARRRTCVFHVFVQQVLQVLLLLVVELGLQSQQDVLVQQHPDQVEGACRHQEGTQGRRPETTWPTALPPPNLLFGF